MINPSPPKEIRQRTVRSFVQRDGRLTKAQKNAIEKLLPIYRLEITKSRSFFDVFKNLGPVILEVGSGDGTTILEMARKYPLRNFIACEVYKSGIGKTLASIDVQGLTNIQIANLDVLELLENIPPHSLELAMIFFPDPWPKARHAKRRLVNDSFLGLIMKRMRKNGRVLIATDEGGYADQILDIADKSKYCRNLIGRRLYSSRPSWRPITNFEGRARKLQNQVWEIALCS